jgi:SNF2 family DNA or RNA helicase
MNVATTQPFQIIYSLFQHEYLGYLLGSYVVQVDSRGKLTYKHQNISLQNAKEFDKGLDERDYELIKLTDSIQQESIIKKFYNKKVKPSEFFSKVYDEKKGDKLIQDAIENYIEGKKTEIFNKLSDKLLFETGIDGIPNWKQIEIAQEKATVLFHFRRNADNTHYFPTIKYKGEKIEFQYKDAIIVCNEPAWLVLNGILYSFEKGVDGNKLKPFLNKKFIAIPRNVEETYYKKFVTQLVASFDVYAVGFTINSENYEPVPVLTFTEQVPATAANLFGDKGGTIEKENYEDIKIVFDFTFKYGSNYFKAEDHHPSSVTLEKTEDSYIFHKIRRKLQLESEFNKFLKERNLDLRHGKCSLTKLEAFDWLGRYKEELLENGFSLRQNSKDSKRYFIGKSSLNLQIKENRDWFDVYAIVRFGEFEISFIQLKKYILSKKKEFVLPNGEIAIIPSEWFTQYLELFALTDKNGQENHAILKKHHLTLIQDLENGNLAQVTMDRKLEKLRDFDSIDDVPLPVNFKGELRPYQKAGYNWMQFLQKYNFGGCLADDMGLGKTVQTLALIQGEKEKSNGTSLLIMPTSLVYNWEQEARKFTPELKVYTHVGSLRNKSPEIFGQYDLVLTSYGIARIDVEILEDFRFNYVILDESQAIKNPSSNISQTVRRLNSRYRLVLSGTPIENSTLDLWSQMSFANPGLLGNEAFFKTEFLTPIEKKNDEEKSQRLFSIIKPFILRRLKQQVIKELPEKIENIKYSVMTEEQEKEYEEVKSSYRNRILEEIDQKGLAQSRMTLLQGLTQLRQIANHPKMVNPDYKGDSGKFDDIGEMIETAINLNHKILVFSQFVKHLSLIREYLDEKKVDYAYLDGSTTDRQSQVERFQNDDKLKLFLISLKAGGVGLNLTKADHVYILDPWWNPAAEAQAIDRAHRIGQKNVVFTYKFITKNTVEEKILSLQKNKLKLANDLITSEESFVKNLTQEDISMLLD